MLVTYFFNNCFIICTCLFMLCQFVCLISFRETRGKVTRAPVAVQVSCPTLDQGAASVNPTRFFPN